jgi:hypothetical protein
MVETAVGLRPFIEVSSVPSSDVKLPLIDCSGKIVELHKNDKVSINQSDTTVWMKPRERLNKFLDRNFTQIQKISILKKIFHGIHTDERHHAIRFLKLLEK